MSENRLSTLLILQSNNNCISPFIFWQLNRLKFVQLGYDFKFLLEARIDEELLLLAIIQGENLSKDEEIRYMEELIAAVKGFMEIDFFEQVKCDRGQLDLALS